MLFRYLLAFFFLSLFVQCNRPEKPKETLSSSKSYFSIGRHSVRSSNESGIDTASIIDTSIPLKGWFISGSNPNEYLMGIDKGAGIDGGDVPTIKSVKKVVDGFGTLMRNMAVDSFLGKRVRMSAWIKTDDLNLGAGLWMRVDGGGTERVTAFDNMSHRPILGTTKWVQYNIVLDVKDNTENIAYGVLVNGEGQIWFDDIEFEIVDETVATTSINSKYRYTDFEK